MSTWSEVSIFFLPLAIGLAVGWNARLFGGNGSFGVAGFNALLTMVASIIGMALQHRMEVESFLNDAVRLAYHETLSYANRTASIQDTESLRRAMSGSEVAVVGRIAARRRYERFEDFWFARNLAHVHWIACRKITVYGQGGPERTVLEAFRVMPNKLFLDDVIRAESEKPITDADIERYYAWEQYYLKRMADGEVKPERFADPVILAVRTGIDWASYAAGGFGLVSGMFAFLGSLLAYRIVRRVDEDKTV
ncbi:MAG: hypothetical protein AB1705_25465 [Verrucomicrobiota bacterium]